MDCYREAMRFHIAATLLGQATYEQVRKLAERSGQPGLELRLISGYGTVEETQLTADLWDVSRGRLSLDGFLLRHGFHGPGEGEISSRSWREDPSALVAIVERYRAMSDSDAPKLAAQSRVAEREKAEAELLRGLSPLARRRAALLLRLACRHIPLREVGKGAFVRAIDVGRAAARAAGVQLAQQGVVDDPDDIFYLTAEEIRCGVPSEARGLVAARRKEREEYLGFRLPERWMGQPTPVVGNARVTRSQEVVTGLPISPGVVEGNARVLRSADEIGAVAEGDVLVCETTDPSWAAAFLVVSALVIDVGGPMSHGAIVAREMGVPCVINTRIGTQVLQTGDLVRVDGARGIVTVLTRAEVTRPLGDVGN
jgi:pyruvate,water dikinase